MTRPSCFARSRPPCTSCVRSTAPCLCCSTSTDTPMRRSPRPCSVRSAPSRPGCTGPAWKCSSGCAGAAWSPRWVMNCLECHELLHRALDGDRDVVGPALDRHLATCSSCRALHAAAQRLGEGLRLLPSPALPPGLTQRLVTGVLRARRRRQRLRRLGTLTAVAAGLLLVVYAGFLGRRPPAPPLTPRPMVEVE